MTFEICRGARKLKFYSVKVNVRSLFWRFSISIIASISAMLFAERAFADCAGIAEEKMSFGLWDEAFEILQPCADSADRDAQALLGGLYSLPQTGRQSDDLTIFWTKRAAEAGSSLALSRLAHFYELGALGLPRDFEEAARTYQAAIDAGDDSARFRLAQMALFGRGMARSESVALDLLKNQKEKTNDLEGDAEFQIASMYRSGYERSGEGADLIRAKRFYDISARMGHRGAQYRLGTLIWELGPPDQFLVGAVWISVAARNEHPLALETMEYLTREIPNDFLEMIDERTLECFESEYQVCPWKFD